MLRNARKPLIATAAASIIALVAAACGDGTGSDGGGGSPSPGPAAGQSEAVKEIAAQGPAALKQEGTLTVAADATYAPNEFIAEDGTTVIGMDADLAKALGRVLGL